MRHITGPQLKVMSDGKKYLVFNDGWSVTIDGERKWYLAVPASALKDAKLKRGGGNSYEFPLVAVVDVVK